MRGDGRVYPQKNSPFWWIAFYHNGKEVREVARHLKTGAKLQATEEERERAQKYLKYRLGQIEGEKHGGKAFAGPQKEKVTIRELLDGLKADYSARHKWNGKVESNLKPLAEEFGNLRADALSKPMVTAYVVKLQAEGYKDATCNRRIQLLTQAYRIADREPPRVKKLAEKNTRRGFFERGDFLRVIDNLPEHLRDFCRFAYIAGWRLGSLQGLEWSDVNATSVILPGVLSKNGEPVSVPMRDEAGFPTDIAEIIARRQAARVITSPYVFHGKDGARIGDFRKSWKTACRLAGVSGRLFHDFRRTSARNLVLSGTPESVCMQITGHSTSSMFKRYAIVSEAQKSAALRNVSQYHQAEDERQKPVTLQ